MVFVYRLERQLAMLKACPLTAKFGGATGNYNAHHVAYPQYDWKQLSRMTHLEPFRYPQPHYVLFDYQERNPLNYEAKGQVIRNPIL